MLRSAFKLLRAVAKFPAFCRSGGRPALEADSVCRLLVASLLASLTAATSLLAPVSDTEAALPAWRRGLHNIRADNQSGHYFGRGGVMLEGRQNYAALSQVRIEIGLCSLEAESPFYFLISFLLHHHLTYSPSHL